MKGFYVIMQNNVPQYHPSYTEEENTIFHNYIKTAKDHELVCSIYKLCNLYPQPEQDKVLNALNRFSEEISERNQMKQIYEKLLQCRDAWRQYNNSLYEYPNVLKIRKYYQKYKKNHTSRYQDCPLYQMFFEEYIFMEEDNKINDDLKDFLHMIKYKNLEYVRRCLLSETSKNGIQKPIKPDVFYESLESVPCFKLNPEESLEKLGSDNLKYLLIMLLQFIDTTNNENKSAVILSFLTRKYSYESHKKHPLLFSSPIINYNELREKSLCLLEELKYLKKEAESLENFI